MKRVVVFLLLAVLLTSAFAVAEEQVQNQIQTYSGLNRFVDNVRLLFSGGDNKVRLALEIREKEVNSAIENVQTDEAEKADKNLEKAWEKLQLIQEKVSVNTAGEVKQNSEQVRNTIQTQENLPDDFRVYALEEEKTGLTAEWVIEKSGEEGQTLGGEVEVVYEINGERVVKIENRIDQIDNEIAEWVVEHTYAEGTSAGGEAGVVVEGGLTKVVKNEVASGDNGLKPEVKTSVAKNEVAEDDKGGYAPGTGAGGDSPGDTIDDTYDDDYVNNGDCGEGVRCGGEDDVIEGGEGSPGENHLDDASDSNEGDSESSEGESSSGGGSGDSSITGEAIIETESEDNFLTRLFNRFFI